MKLETGCLDLNEALVAALERIRVGVVVFERAAPHAVLYSNQATANLTGGWPTLGGPITSAEEGESELPNVMRAALPLLRNGTELVACTPFFLLGHFRTKCMVYLSKTTMKGFGAGLSFAVLTRYRGGNPAPGIFEARDGCITRHGSKTALEEAEGHIILAALMGGRTVAQRLEVAASTAEIKKATRRLQRLNTFWTSAELSFPMKRCGGARKCLQWAPPVAPASTRFPSKGKNG